MRRRTTHLVLAAITALALLAPAACSSNTKDDVKKTGSDLSTDAKSDASNLSSDASSLSDSLSSSGN